MNCTHPITTELSSSNSRGRVCLFCGQIFTNQSWPYTPEQKAFLDEQRKEA